MTRNEFDLLDDDNTLKPLFCKKCGASVDHVSKTCSGCGHQFFRFPRFTRIHFVVILLAFLLCASVCELVVLSVQFVDLQNSYRLSEQSYDGVWNKLKNTEFDVRTLKSRVTTLQNSLTELHKKSDIYKTKADFLDNNIAIVTKTGNKIHKLDCHHLYDVDWFYYMTIEDALNRGYTYCSDCK